MKILSLDISTTKIGLSIFENNNLIKCEAIKVLKKKYSNDTMFNDLLAMATSFYNTYEWGQLDVVIIEEPLMSSMNRNTVNKLIMFNSIISTMFRNNTNVIIHQNVNRVRSWLFKSNEITSKVEDKKLETINIINKIYNLNLSIKDNDTADALMHYNYYYNNEH